VTIHRLDEIQLRVLGCLIEKQRTTPEQYPLTLNALRLACNQATNREPVMELDESQVRGAAQSLGTLGWARLATGPGSRTPKYRQLFSEALDLMPAEVSILAVLMLRGAQTVAELKARTARLHHFASTDDVASVLARLDERELVRLLPRQPGQREERWVHLLAEEHSAGAPAPSTEAATLEQRLAQVEDRVAELERRLDER
jgi:uncharacterized protein YceH (UPF0502 family)